MSLLILSFDSSSDKIGTHLYNILNSTLSSNYPHIASLCTFNQLFSSSVNDYEKIINNSLKIDSLSHNDLLGFLILIDIATTNKLHIDNLPSITSLLIYLNQKHPFQQILTFIIHASSTNQLYTSSLTCFNLNLIFSHIYSFVNGIIFNNIDKIDDYENYHKIIAIQISSIFLPVSSLREDKKRVNKSVCIEFLQFIQHLLNNPNKKVLIMITNNLKKFFNQSSYASLLIQRGKPSLTNNDIQLNNLDIWNSLEKNRQQLQSTLILNNDQFNSNLLDKLILQPYYKKIHMNKAYLYWLRKKFDRNNIEEQLKQGILLCENIILDK
ncbi:unnamed protein product [Adineta steineri]|uniref:Uncharacterized protein n=1 Tax=Adineta steineri TaxID=433720 RepID=A0A815E304_9BILA|nr:unnamed protein product [Adineta steineri]CAF1305774.1 unnamed protein product [Adineta steineri]